MKKRCGSCKYWDQNDVGSFRLCMLMPKPIMKEGEQWCWQFKEIENDKKNTNRELSERAI